MQPSYVTLQVPQISVNDVEVRVVEWRVADGNEVVCGEIVAVVESSKAAQEIEAPVAGFIRHNAPEGTDAKVGDALAFLAQTLDALPQRPSRETERIAVKATAKAQELAKVSGFDLSGIKKTGIITEQDVRDALAKRQTATPATGAPASRRIPLSAVQVSVRRAVEQSVRETASAYLLGTADVTGTLEQLGTITERDGIAVALTDLLIREAARALAEFPLLNARLADPDVQLYDRINVGVTVEAHDDLYAVVIADADKLSLAQIAEKRAGYVMQLFRKQALGNEALRGGTFTVTVLQQPAILHQVPIIFPEQAGIIGLGAVQDVLRKIGNDVVARKTVGISVSYDHRFVNGNYAAKFLQAVTTALESFNANA